MKNLTKLEWLILDSLADDEECVATMEIREASVTKVRKMMYKLFERGLIYADTEPVEYDKLMEEPEESFYACYWFGLTELGVKYWEEGAETYSDGPIDWSESYTGYLSYENREGYIDGTSPEVCLVAFNELDINQGWQIDMNTVVQSNIDGFKAKYYKYIPGGHRISFKLKKKSNPQ